MKGTGDEGYTAGSEGAIPIDSLPYEAPTTPSDWAVRAGAVFALGSIVALSVLGVSGVPVVVAGLLSLVFVYTVVDGMRKARSVRRAAESPCVRVIEVTQVELQPKGVLRVHGIGIGGARGWADVPVADGFPLYADTECRRVVVVARRGLAPWDGYVLTDRGFPFVLDVPGIQRIATAAAELIPVEERCAPIADLRRTRRPPLPLVSPPTMREVALWVAVTIGLVLIATGVTWVASIDGGPKAVAGFCLLWVVLGALVLSGWRHRVFGFRVEASGVVFDRSAGSVHANWSEVRGLRVRVLDQRRSAMRLVTGGAAQLAGMTVGAALRVAGAAANALASNAADAHAARGADVDAFDARMWLCGLGRSGTISKMVVVGTRGQSIGEYDAGGNDRFVRDVAAEFWSRGLDVDVRA